MHSLGGKHCLPVLRLPAAGSGCKDRIEHSGTCIGMISMRFPQCKSTIWQAEQSPAAANAMSGQFCALSSPCCYKSCKIM